MNRYLLLAVVSVLSLIVLLFSIKVSPAHDHDRPGLNEWLKTLHSKGGTWCCDGNDTDAIEAWTADHGKYRVKFRGEWFDVPEEAVVGEPNKSGDALLWMNRGYMGLSVRCFMPGTLS